MRGEPFGRERHVSSCCRVHSGHTSSGVAACRGPGPWWASARSWTPTSYGRSGRMSGAPPGPATGPPAGAPGGAPAIHDHPSIHEGQSLAPGARRRWPARRAPGSAGRPTGRLGRAVVVRPARRQRRPSRATPATAVPRDASGSRPPAGPPGTAGHVTRPPGCRVAEAVTSGPYGRPSVPPDGRRRLAYPSNRPRLAGWRWCPDDPARWCVSGLRLFSIASVD
jgi:hypothetical protein